MKTRAKKRLGRVALAKQIGNDEHRSAAERALIKERAAGLRATFGREAHAKEQK